MRRYVHQYSSGVWVDSCEVHGIWLDAGELERLEAYAEATARGMSATNAANVANSGVGVEPARISTTSDAIDELRPAESVWDHPAAVLVPGTGVLSVLGSLVDGAMAWRRLGSKAARTREDELVEQARRDAGSHDTP